jgi:hypothetical protein
VSKFWRRLFACVAILIGASSIAAADEPRRSAGYQHYVVGNAADVSRPTAGLWVLQGGGDDVDENYVRMGMAAVRRMISGYGIGVIMLCHAQGGKVA